MSIFEVDTENDLYMKISKYEELYLKELSYYGTSDKNSILILMTIGQQITKLEIDMLNNYYNPCVDLITSKNPNILDFLQINSVPEIYFLQKILFDNLNIILKMCSLVVNNKLQSIDLELKNKYMIGMMENFVEKFVEPILSNINLLVFVFQPQISYCLINDLKKFILDNKNKFTSNDKLTKLEKFIQVVE